MIEWNNIYNGDCNQLIKKINDEIIDLTITSPPYNLGEKHHTHSKTFIAYDEYIDSMPENDYQINQINILNEIYRITKNNGSLFYNHKNRIKNGLSISPYQWLFKTNWNIKQELIWQNGTPNFDKCRFYPQTERIFWLSKSNETNFNNNLNLSDIFKDAPVGSNEKHKRSFPVKLIQKIINCFDKCEIVFDPYSGSGTTAIASIRENKKYIGFEISKNYYELSIKRIINEKSQLKLF